MAEPVISATGVSASAAAARYGQVASGPQGAADAGAANAGAANAGADFSALLGRAVQGVVDAGHQADAQAHQAVLGQGNLTDVVSAVSQADLALQTTTAIRDRVVQAYQDIMKMPI